MLWASIQFIEEGSDRLLATSRRCPAIGVAAVGLRSTSCCHSSMRSSGAWQPASFGANGLRVPFTSDRAGILNLSNATPVSMVLVEHWFEELKQRVNEK